MLDDYGSSSLFRCIHDSIISKQLFKNHKTRENTEEKVWRPIELSREGKKATLKNQGHKT